MTRRCMPEDGGERLGGSFVQMRSLVISPLASMGAAVLLLGLGGCATVSSTNMAGFGRSASSIGRQAEMAFSDANRIGRDAAVEEFIRTGGVGLTEAALPPLISPQVATAWLDALGGLERYGMLLSSLSDPDRASDVSLAMGDLGAQLNGLGTGISPGVASGFAGLAGAIVDASAQRKALGFLRATDPQVRSLLTNMASAVGAADERGLRGTVTTNWIRTFSPLQNTYAVATEAKDERLQRATIATFLDRVEKRDAQLRSLAALRLSLLALADAHSAAAAGSGRPAAELLAVVEARLDQVREIHDELSKKEGTK